MDERASDLAASNGGRERPVVLVVGGCEVHRRIDLMTALSGRFSLAAVGSEAEIREHFVGAGLEYYRYPLSRGVSPFGDLRSVVRLMALFRNVRPDIVHAFGTKPSVWARLAARWVGVPVVIGTLPGLGSLYVAAHARARLARRAYEGLQRYACAASDVTIFQNHDDAKQLAGAGVVAESKAVVLPGSGVRTDVFDRAGVPASEVASVRSELGADPQTIVVTMVARAIRSKGVLEFADAACLVRRGMPGVRFVLVGRDDRESLERLGPDEWRRVRGAVDWLGERRDVREILAASDVFALPSFYREGVPRALMEAASTGLPIVTTRAPGCVEVVEHGRNGLLVPPKDSATLAKAITRLARDPALRARFGRASRALAVERFDHSMIAERTAELYGELLQRARAAPLHRPSSNGRGARRIFSIRQTR